MHSQCSQQPAEGVHPEPEQSTRLANPPPLPPPAVCAQVPAFSSCLQVHRIARYITTQSHSLWCKTSTSVANRVHRQTISFPAPLPHVLLTQAASNHSISSGTGQRKLHSDKNLLMLPFHLLHPINGPCF
jgi:hypothetical protein